MKDKRGFTLIELMIVMGIVGLLASMAVVGYQSFLVKAKRSEVLANLDGLYKGETAYFGEANSYTDNFVLIRWKPEGNKGFYTYTVGAQYFGIPPLFPEPGPDGTPGGTIPAGASQYGFTAYGWGNVDNDPKMDVWYINDMKELVNQAADGT
jgi:prepilin-type N-terminal cleavage/methylation domain-containing protein